MEMDDRLYLELTGMLKEMKNYLQTQKRTSRRRPTEMIPVSAEVVVRRLLEEQRDKCIKGWERAVDVKLGYCTKEIEDLTKQHKDLYDKIFKAGGVANGTKTSSESYRTLNGRVANIEERLHIPGDGVSYESRMKDLEDWVQTEKQRRKEEAEKTQRSFGKTTTVISIALAFLFGAAGLIVSIIQLLS